MLLGLNSLIVIMLRDADRAKMLDFLTTNRALLGDLLRIAPRTNRMGDMHPVETLDAILRYFDKYSVVPTESQLRDYSATIPRANETLGMSQKVRDQLDELADFKPSMTDLNVLPSDALSEARNHWLQSKLQMAADICTQAVENKKGKQLLGADDALAYLDHHRTKDITKDDGLKPKGELFHTHLTTSFYVQCMADIKPEPVVWLWEGRIPQGMLCIFSGLPGIGKSFVSTYIAARVSTGTAWTDGVPSTLPPSKVLMLVAEDDPARTVAPRLLAAGADMTNIFTLNQVKATDFVKQGREETLVTSLRELQLKEDIRSIRSLLDANPDIRLVIFDPITGYYGCDQADDKVLRPVMNALSDLCRETGVAVLAISHLNKRKELDALQQILGGSSFTGTARAIWAFSTDPDKEDVRHMAVVKLNVDEPAPGLQFRLTKAWLLDGTTLKPWGDGVKPLGGIKTGYVDWLGTTNYTADSLIAEKKDKARSGGKGVDMALVFLTAKFNTHFEYKCTDLYREGEAEGISEDQLKRAKAKLGLVSDGPRKDGWWWIRIKPEEQPLTMAAGEVL